MADDPKSTPAPDDQNIKPPPPVKIPSDGSFIVGAQPAPAPSKMDAVGKIVDHINSSLKIMREQGSPFESTVPLVTPKKSLPEDDLLKLYELLKRENEPAEQSEYPFFNKTEDEKIVEGTQIDKYFRTKIDDVRVVESWEKESNQLLEAHIVIGPITKSE